MSHKLTMYENLRDMLEAELGKHEAAKVLTKEALQEIHQITTSLEYIDQKIEDCKELKWMEEHPEEAGASGRYDRASYGMSGRRLTMSSSYGRYGRHSGSYFPTRDLAMSRDNAKRSMTRKLSTLMDETMSEEDRAAITECIDRINNS